MKVKHQEIVRFDRDDNGNMTYKPFKANGKTYKFIKPGDPIGISKWSEYQKLSIVVGGGVTFADLVVGLREHGRMLAGARPPEEKIREGIVWADSQMKGIIDLSKSRFDKAFYLASIFIYEDGTDPYEWSNEIAEAMVENWAIGRVHDQDLFFFAINQVVAWNTMFVELSEEKERQAARSLVDIILNKLRGR